MKTVETESRLGWAAANSRLIAGQRSRALADRLMQGANALATFAATLTEAEWQVRVPNDGRKIGVVIHHVANMYPLEIQLAMQLTEGKPIAGVTWDDVQRGECRSCEGIRRRNHERGSRAVAAQQRGRRGRDSEVER